jgi:hypothetical protein
MGRVEERRGRKETIGEEKRREGKGILINSFHVF